MHCVQAQATCTLCIGDMRSTKQCCAQDLATKGLRNSETFLTNSQVQAYLGLQGQR